MLRCSRLQWSLLRPASLVTAVRWKSNVVLLLCKFVAVVFISYVDVDVGIFISLTGTLAFLSTRQIRVIIRVRIASPLSSFAQRAGAIDVRQRTKTFLSGFTAPMISIVRTLKHVPLAAIDSFAAIAKSSKGAAHEGRSRNGDVGIAACTVRAVAAEEICACWHPMIYGLV